MSEDGTAGTNLAGAAAPTPAILNGDPAIAVPGKTIDYTDGRAPYDWKSRFPVEACKHIRCEAIILGAVLVLLICFTSVALVFSSATYTMAFPTLGPNASANVDPRLIVLFFSGGVGGTTFSIKWLIHAVAKGSWHLDRQLWRLFVPLVGGVYACAVLTLLDTGMILGHAGEASRGTASAASMAFLIGYFPMA